MPFNSQLHKLACRMLVGHLTISPKSSSSLIPLQFFPTKKSTRSDHLSIYFCFGNLSGPVQILVRTIFSARTSPQLLQFFAEICVRKNFSAPNSEPKVRKSVRRTLFFKCGEALANTLLFLSPPCLSALFFPDK